MSVDGAGADARKGERRVARGRRLQGALVIFVVGFIAGVGVMALVQDRPRLPRQYEITGTVSAVSGDGKGFAIRTPDGRVLGYGLDYSTEGSELIEVVARFGSPCWLRDRRPGRAGRCERPRLGPPRAAVCRAR